MKKAPKASKEFQVAFPVVIKLGYQDIRITEDDLVEAQGCYQSDPPRIRVKGGMEGRERLNTILHELIHAVLFVYGLKKDFKDDDEEERLVNALGNGLTEALVRNKSLVQFLSGASNGEESL